MEKYQILLFNPLPKGSPPPADVISLQFQQQYTHARSFTELKTLIKNKKFDLLIMNLTSLTQKEIQMTQILQKNFTLPILAMVTPETVKEVKKQCHIENDELILTPFHPLELQVKVNSLLLLKKIDHGRQSWLIRGNLKIHLKKKEVYLIEKNQEIKIELFPNEFRILVHLAQHMGIIMTRERLLHDFKKTSRTENERAVDFQISKIRKKVKSASFKIETVQGVGYQFVLTDTDDQQSKKAA